MLTSYYNEQGERVVIAEMPRPYLLNAHAKYKKRQMSLIANRHKDGFKRTARYLTEVNEIVQALESEMGRREKI